MFEENEINQFEETSFPTNDQQYWLQDIYRQITERNTNESLIHKTIYQEYSSVWNKYIKLDNHRENAKHQLNIFENESTEFLLQCESQEYKEYFYKKIEYIRQLLDPIEIHQYEPLPVINLSKVIFDQKKLINNQNEELRVSKQELSSLMSKLADYETILQEKNQQLENYTKETQEQTKKIEELELRVNDLYQENEILTSRIISEKEKSVDEMNKMNSIIEDLKAKTI